MGLHRFGLLLLLILFFCIPAFADGGDQGCGIESISVEQFFSHFQTKAGSTVSFPETRFKGTLRLNPRWRIFFVHYRGTSPLNNGFQASIGDFESRVAFRLDDPKNAVTGDSPFQ